MEENSSKYKLHKCSINVFQSESIEERKREIEKAVSNELQNFR